MDGYQEVGRLAREGVGESSGGPRGSFGRLDKDFMDGWQISRVAGTDIDHVVARGYEFTLIVRLRNKSRRYPA